MEKQPYEHDHILVRQCLAGSETAWQEFYSRFVGLMRSVVKRQPGISPQDVEDVTQSAFLTLTTALLNYDFSQSLPRFVCLITERVLIDECRRRKAAKREGEYGALQYDETIGENEATDIRADSNLPDEMMERVETVSQVRDALTQLDPACRALITLRYYKELPFSDISQIVGVTENTATVQTRRCLDKLRAKLGDLDRRGDRSGKTKKRG